MKYSMALCQLLLVAGLVAAEPLDVGSAKHLFIDGKFLSSSSGVEIVVNKPEVRDEKLVVQDKPWEDLLIGGYQSVIQEDSLVHLWYETADLRGGWGVAYARSDDYGATWTKPNLYVVEYDGSTSNNLVMMGIHGNTVFRNRPDAPPEERYAMFVGAPNEAFVSPDGIHWTQKGTSPFLNMNGYTGLDSQNVMFWDTRLEEYVAYPRIWDPNSPFPGITWERVVGRSQSDIFGNFSNPEIIFRADGGDTPDLPYTAMDFYTSAAVEYPWAEDAYFMFPAAYYHESPENANKGPANIQFAASRDGVQWERYDRDHHIIRGFDADGNPDDNWEERFLGAGYGFTRHGDEISLYYKSNAAKHGYALPDGGVGSIITRATYRLDGFTSVDATTTSGEFTTPTLTFEGAQLLFNATVEVDGGLLVELLDEYGDPIPGFTLDDADPLTGDSVAMAATWGGSGDLSSLIDREIQLHVFMAHAKLYAFQFVADPVLAGDANRDGKVDDMDATILATNWQKTGGAVWSEGDFTYDGNVDYADATILAANWQKTIGGESSVPEPSTLGLILGAAALLLVRRLPRRRTKRSA